jgi:hypothetical protein
MKRLWIWRAAMATSAIVTVFFAFMSVAPFDTVGEPIFDTVLLRGRYYGDFGIVFVHLAALVLWLIAGVSAESWRRALCAALAFALLGFCLFAIAHEGDSLIQYGGLRDTPDIAAHKLMVSRILTLGSAVLGLVAGWFARPKACHSPP